MANTLKFGSGQWATKVGSTLAYNDEGGNFKPLPFNFTRSTIATRVNKEGLIEVVTNNKPRIDFLNDSNGALLLEPERRNLIQYSEDFSQGWTASNIVIGSASSISPNGSLSAFNIKSNSISGGKYIYDDNSVSVSTTYTLSGFFKKKTHNFASLLINQRTSASGYIGQLAVNIDLVNGVIDTENFATAPTLINSKIENYGNGWYRVVLTATTSSTAAIIRSCVGLAGSISRFEYFGTVSDEVYAFGIQLEQGSYPTSYIPNYGTALGVTRSAETCNNAGNSQIFNDSEGVLFAEISALANDETLRFLSLSNGTINQRIVFGFPDFSNIIRVVSGSSNLLIEANLDIENNNKISLIYESNNVNLWVNGFKVGTSNSYVPMTGFNSLNFNSGAGSSPFYGKTKEIAYYGEILTDLELEYMTSYRSLNEMVTELNLNAL